MIIDCGAARLESMQCALKIFRAQESCHAGNSQSGAQNLKNRLEKYAVSYRKEKLGLLFQARRCDGGKYLESRCYRFSLVEDCL